MKITIQDIAIQAGVSKTTVSRYLNGKYGSMSVATRERIRAIIAESGYRPSPQAKYLKSKKSYLIGLLVADIENLYSAYLIKAIQDALIGTEYQLLIMNTNNSKEAEQRALRRLLDQNIDGIFLQPVASDLQDFQSLQTAGIPTVLIDRSLHRSPWTTVQSDNFQSAREVAKLILGKGYRRIVHVTEPMNQISSRIERYEGIQFEAANQGLPVDLVELTERVQSLQAYLKNQPLTEATAFFAANGNALQDLLTVLQAEQLTIPKDCGVVGFDDWFWAGLVSPGITTVQQNPYEIGRRASELLIQAMQKELPVAKIEIPSELVIRHSL